MAKAKQGWIPVHRQLQEHWLWADKPFSKGQAWIDILLLANHDDNRFLLGNELVEVKAGSFITSELKLMERWGWGKEKTRNFLKLLQQDGMITKKSDRKKTTIIVENYSVYALFETTSRPQTDREQTASRLQPDCEQTQTTMINNENNENNEKQKKVFKPPTLEEVRDYCCERMNTVDPEAFIDFYASKGWMIGKDKMKDWKAAVRTWERRNSTRNTGGKQNKTADMLDESYKMIADWSES